MATKTVKLIKPWNTYPAGAIQDIRVPIADLLIQRGIAVLVEAAPPSPTETPIEQLTGQPAETPAEPSTGAETDTQKAVQPAQRAPIRQRGQKAENKAPEGK